MCHTNLWRGGKHENWYSKSITKHKLELPTYLVQKLDILSRCAFYKKISFVHYLSNGTLGTFVALMEAELRQLLCRVIFARFCNFLLFLSAQVLVSAQNLPNITLHSNCCSSASIGAKKVPKVPFER